MKQTVSAMKPFLAPGEGFSKPVVVINSPTKTMGG
jgi:hypothetical protein